MSKIPFILVLVFCFSISFAQRSGKPDSTYILSYADKFVVKLNVDTQTDTYDLINMQEGGTPFRVAANNNYRLFLSLDYQFFGLSVGFSPPSFIGNQDEDLKGASSFSDFRFRAALGQWIQGFQISSIAGYFVENTGDFIPGWNEGTDPYLQIPDLKTQLWGMSTSYVFNPNFSFRNILYNTEWQRKSAGSFIPTLFYSYNRISYSLEDVNSREDVFPIRLALGYYYTFVVKQHWFMNVNLSPSLGVRFSKLSETIDITESVVSKTSFTRSLEGNFQVGYASRKIVFGLGFTFDVNGYEENAVNAVLNDRFYGNINFGYRFNAPPFIDRTYTKFAKKLGLD